MDQIINVQKAEKSDISVLMDQLSSNLNGLSSQEAQNRLITYGLNEVIEEKVSSVRKFFNFFWGPIPWMIEIALLLSILIQEWEEFAVIFVLLIINGLVGFYQEYTADNTIDLLKEKLSYKADVIRDGEWIEIPSKDIVPGDIVRVSIGDIIPADIKLISDDYITVDESALTGESLPLDKKIGDLAYSGSIVQRGNMHGLVISTGSNTYFGKAAELVTHAKQKSHLEEAVIKIGDYLIILDGLMVSLIFIAGLFRHQSLFDILGFSLVLTIASIPVAQPAVLSVTMTVGATALAKMKAIVSKLTAIEEIASMDVLFSDKTGTLTRNKIIIAEIVPYNKYTREDVLLYAALSSLKKDSDPIDQAIFDMITESKTISNKLKRYKTIKFDPFDPVRKSTAAEIEYNGTHHFKVSKGAPQVIISNMGKDKILKKDVTNDVDNFAEKGYRSLGIAKTNEAGSWIFVGLITLYDVPRKTSKETIKKAESMGINVKMVTGDHVAIARQTAKEIGLGTNILLPASFINKTDSKAGKLVDEADGFAEVFPEHKYHLVDILQMQNKIVGMTGDGVNDAPALKKANVGIAVANAVDAAKSAADIVFTQPGLSVIINAIKESYKIFHRMKSYSIYRVAETIGILIFTAMTILIFNIYPITALMLVFIALLDDIPVMTIAYDRTEQVNNPQRWNMSQILSMSTFLGIIGVASSFILFYIGLSILHLNLAVLQSLIFLKLVVAGHLTMFVTRNSGHFWSVRPSAILFWSVILTDVFATLIVVYGILLTPIGWLLALLVWIYSLAVFIIQDQLKIIFSKILAKRIKNNIGKF